MILFVIHIALALKVTTIPSTGPPPLKLCDTQSIYDPIENQIISFGGIDSDSVYHSTISFFHLNSNTWTFSSPESLLIPPGLTQSKLALRQDRKLLVFFGLNNLGISSDVYSYDLTINTWTTVQLLGDPIQGVYMSASDSFIFNNTQYIAIFGGINRKGASNSLYIIDTVTFMVRKLPNAGIIPGKKISVTLQYYNRCLYLYGINWNSFDEYSQEVLEYSLDYQQWKVLPVTGEKPVGRNYHFASIHQSLMYIYYGSVSGSDFSEIWRFNISSYKWTLLLNNSENARFSSSSVMINNKFYLLFGRNSSFYFNSIDLYEFVGDSVKILSLTSNCDVPPGRSKHLSAVIWDKMYIFGGVSVSGEYLNDMWMFDLTINTWTQIFASGDVPSPRSSVSSLTGDGLSLICFFGRDSNQVYNDIYMFDTFSNTWSKPASNGDHPTSRFDSSVCESSRYNFIIGGQNYDEAFDDLWLYDGFLNSFKLLTSKKSLPFKLVKHNCWVVEKGDILELFVIGGSTVDSIANTNLYKIILSPNDDLLYEFNVSIVFNSFYLGVSDTSFIKTADSVILINGLMYNLYVIDTVVSLNYKTFQLTVESIDSFPSSYGHSAVHYRDSIYVFGGILSLDDLKLYSLPSNRLLKLTKSNESNSIQFACGGGSLGLNCTPCPAGTYLNYTQCVDCPAGTYSIFVAGESSILCIPCKFGTFTEKTGSVMCLDCPSDSYCPIGSSKGTVAVAMPRYQNNQPDDYTPPNLTILDSFMNYSWFGILGSTMIFAILVMRSKPIQSYTQKFDIFVDKHSQQLGVPVVYRKTIIGGLFSILLILLAVLIISMNFLNYYLSNISEMRTLVPSSTMKEHIVADLFEVEVIYYYYGANCEENNQCPLTTFFNETGIEYNSRVIFCKTINDHCLVNVKYFGFYMSKGSSRILIRQNTFKAFASYISVNVTVSSSIPEGPSNIFIPIYLESKDKIFRGDKPTRLYYELTPTVNEMQIFTSESSQWSQLQTGYHIKDTLNVEIGENVDQSTMFNSLFLKVELDLTFASNGFIISRNINSSLFVMVGAMLGSIFGLAGTIASIMSFSENTVNTILRKAKRKQMIKALFLERRTIKSTLQNEKKIMFVKIHPIKELANETVAL